MIYRLEKEIEYIFDYDVVEKYEITNFPLDTEFLNKPESFYSKYKTIITTLGDVIETKSEGTANHVQRVAKISVFLAQKVF